MNNSHWRCLLNRHVNYCTCMDHPGLALSKQYGQLASEPQLIRYDIVENLFDTLHKNGIVYCHWKSNEHLGAGMQGNTDLDVLFSGSQKGLLVKILEQQQFKLFQPSRQKQYDGIEDYIGLDCSSGKIFHLHAHFKLTLGENYLKSYQLNLEEKILDTRVFDNDFYVFRIHPAFELVLLYIRSAFKIRTRDKVKIYLGKNIHLPANTMKEYQWLKGRCRHFEAEAFLKQIFSDWQAVSRIMQAGFNRVELLELLAIIKKQFRQQRLFSPLQALFARWQREFSIKMLRRFSRLASNPVVVKRINPRGGLAIALVGADGSGKSTVLKSLETTFKTKLDVYSIYFGKGGGKVSWYRRWLLALKRSPAGLKQPGAGKGLPKAQKPANGLKMPGKRTALQQFFFIAEAMMVMREKLVNHRNMQKAKAKGMLVICDRYPQNEVKGYNDGPALQRFCDSKNPLLRLLARREAGAYEYLQQNPPDIIYKLIADVEVIAARKPGQTGRDVLTRKLESIRALTFSPPCRVVTINANRPLQEVLTGIRENIWNAIN